MPQADLIIDSLPATSKKQALEMLAQHAAGLFYGEPDALFAGMLEREKLGSTGIGGGAAIPHLKIDGLKRPYGLLVKLLKPIDYGAPDSAPVDLFFMLLVPAGERTTVHLKEIAQAARFLRDPDIRARLRSGNRGMMADILAEWLRKQLAA